MLIMAFIAWLTFPVRRTGSASTSQPTRPPEPTTAGKDDLEPGIDPGTGAEEAEEAELARQLLESRIDPATYRDRMAELTARWWRRSSGRR
jgi:hypothetical protein